MSNSGPGFSLFQQMSQQPYPAAINTAFRYPDGRVFFTDDTTALKRPGGGYVFSFDLVPEDHRNWKRGDFIAIEVRVLDSVSLKIAGRIARRLVWEFLKLSPHPAPWSELNGAHVLVAKGGVIV